jgi:hypothetical protein
VNITRHLCLILFFLTTGSACSYIRHSVSTESDRKVDLYALTTKVIKAYQWQSFEELSPMLSPHMSTDSMYLLDRFYKSKKIKEAEVEQLDFEEDAFKAYQIISVRTFSAPKFMLETHLDQITWEFTKEHGTWKIIKIDTGNSGGSDAAELPQ